MRLHLLLPKVDPKAIPVPSKCAYANCKSLQVRLHQPVKKALRDTVHQQVEAHRYRCLKCGRTFRVYPPGVSHAQSSDRVKGLAVLLYLLGLSYGAVSLALESLGVPLSNARPLRAKPIPQFFTGSIQVQLLYFPGKGVLGGKRTDVAQDHLTGRSLLQHAKKQATGKVASGPGVESLKVCV